MVETWQQIALGILVIVVFASFVKEWLSPEVVAIGALVICVLIGVLPIAVAAPTIIPRKIHFQQPNPGESS